MIDIEIGRGRILTLDPSRIFAISDKQLSNGCKVYIDGMDPLELSISREEFIINYLNKDYERKHNDADNHLDDGDWSDDSDSSDEFDAELFCTEYRNRRLSWILQGLSDYVQGRI